MQSKSIVRVVGLLMVALLPALPAATSQAKDSKGSKDPVEIALDHLKLKRSEAKVTDLYTSNHNDVTHVYLRQLIKDVETIGAEATVNIQNGVVIHSGTRFIDPKDATGEPALSADDALVAALGSLRADSPTVTTAPFRAYRVLRDGTARLSYDMEIQTDDQWWNISVDAETGRILARYSLIDSENAGEIAARTARVEGRQEPEAPVQEPILPPLQADDGSSYNVYALPMESPNDGDRIVIENPADRLASPFGWHDMNGIAGPESTITRGNNVNAYADTADDEAPDPASQPDGGAGLDFDHPIQSFDVTPLTYRDAAVDNLFYWNNVMHDVTFRYGFNEEAGNFQASNFSGVGRGGDAVQAEAQDGSGALNANFATPAEGQPGRMQMYLWVDAFDNTSLDAEDTLRTDYDGQVRDGDLDSGVIAHEYGHGISNRLVGGPRNVACLRAHDERQGEGWSDFWSYVLTMRKGDDGATPRGIGTYVVYHEDGRKGNGIRITPYSTDMKINPSTYETIKTAAEPHGVGYVWATMLWDLYWNLVDKHGFNPNPYESWKTGGNNLAIQLVVDGMKFSVCQPGFEDVRDAIIAADAALTGNPAKGVPGDNECLIWRTFARRGLGVDADQGEFMSKVDGKDGFKVPAHCKGSK